MVKKRNTTHKGSVVNTDEIVALLRLWVIISCGKKIRLTKEEFQILDLCAKNRSSSLYGVTEIAKKLGRKQPSVSRSLKKLKDLGLVFMIKKEGRKEIYGSTFRDLSYLSSISQFPKIVKRHKKSSEESGEENVKNKPENSRRH